MTTQTMKKLYNDSKASLNVMEIYPRLNVLQKTEDMFKRQFMDMELSYSVRLSDENGHNLYYMLSNKQIEEQRLDSHVLRVLAWANVQEHLTCERLSEILGVDDEGVEIFVLSTDMQTNGAAAHLINHTKLKELTERFQKDTLCVIPSSKHELLVIIAEEEETPRINQMISNINSTIVSEEDVLSDHCYFYHADTDSFTY